MPCSPTILTSFLTSMRDKRCRAADPDQVHSGSGLNPVPLTGFARLPVRSVSEMP